MNSMTGITESFKALKTKMDDYIPDTISVEPLVTMTNVILSNMKTELESLEYEKIKKLF